MLLFNILTLSVSGTFNNLLPSFCFRNCLFREGYDKDRAREIGISLITNTKTKPLNYCEKQNSKQIDERIRSIKKDVHVLSD